MLTRATRLTVEIVAVAFAGTAILLALAAWRLSTSPVSLAFLTPSIERALSAEDGAFAIRLDRTALAWGGWDRTLDIRAYGLRALGPAGSVLASVPELSVSLSTRALIRGMVAPTRIEALGPRIHLLRGADGAFAFSVGVDTGQGTGVVESTFGGLLAAPDPARATGYLSRVSVLAAEILVEDRKLEKSWNLPAADVTLVRDAAGLRGRLAFNVDIDDESPHFDVDLVYDRDTDSIDFEASFQALDARLVAQIPGLPALFEGVETEFDGTVAGRLDLTGNIGGARFDLAGGPGRVRLPPPFGLDTAIKSSRFRGEFTDGWRRLRVDEAVIDFDGPRISAAGVADGLDGEATLDLRATVSDLPTGRLKELWPQDAAVNARLWITENIGAGRLEAGAFELAAVIPVGGDGGAARLTSLSGDFSFSGLEVAYFRPLPPLREVTGTAKVGLDRIDFQVTGGVVDSLTVEDGQVRITEFGSPIEWMSIDAVLRGKVPAALALLDNPRLALLAGYGIDPAKTRGTLATRLAFRFPLLDDLHLARVEIAAAANARGVALPGPAAGLDVTDGDLTLQLDGKGMEITGTARVGPVPGKVKWRESFDPGAVLQGEYGFVGLFDDAARRAFGVDATPYLQGPVEGDLIYSKGKGGRASLAVALNLTQATLDLADLAWRKAAGADGSARARIDFRDGKPTAIPAFTITAGDLDAAGSGRLKSDGRGLADLRLDRFRLGRTDIGGTLRGRADGGFDLDIAGASFDAAPLLRDRSADRKEPGPAFAARVRIDRIWVAETDGIDAVSGSLVHDGTDWRDIDLDGRLADKEFKLRLVPEAGGRTLAMRAGDAGVAFKALGITENIRGGEVEITGRFDDAQPGSPLIARAEAKNFRLVKAPVMAKLLSIASITGPLTLLDGDGIGFVRLEAPFRMEGERLEIGKGRAYGGALGVTGEGVVDFAADSIEMKGTIVPAYTVNRVLGAIPLVGGLLTGGEGEGVFAANYAVSGTVDDPKISVNPLSVLAPGFLRNLFGILEGGGDGKPPTTRNNN